MGTQELPRMDMNGMNGTVRVAYFVFQGLDFFQGTCQCVFSRERTLLPVSSRTVQLHGHN